MRPLPVSQFPQRPLSLDPPQRLHPMQHEKGLRLRFCRHLARLDISRPSRFELGVWGRSFGLLVSPNPEDPQGVL